MGVKSSIALLPPDIRQRLDQMIRDGSHTIDDIVEEIQSLGGDVKRTAVGNYKQRMEKSLSRLKEAQEVAGVWAERFAENPNSQMGQLIAEILKGLAFRTLSDLGESDDGAKPMDLMLLSKMLQQVSSAQKSDLEFRGKLRAELMAEVQAKAETAAEEVTKEARAAGLSAEAEANMRRIVFGVVS